MPSGTACIEQPGKPNVSDIMHLTSWLLNSSDRATCQLSNLQDGQHMVGHYHYRPVLVLDLVHEDHHVVAPECRRSVANRAWDSYIF
jgi:hypothetical protein